MAAEDVVTCTVTFSSLIAAMFTGIDLKYREAAAYWLSAKYNKLWICAEIILFVLVGVTSNIHYEAMAAIYAALLIAGVLFFGSQVSSTVFWKQVFLFNSFLSDYII